MWITVNNTLVTLSVTLASQSLTLITLQPLLWNDVPSHQLSFGTFETNG